MQNVSHAVMAQRKEPKDSRDDFPTPPWNVVGPPRLIWNPPCRRQLERPGDYDLPRTRGSFALLAASRQMNRADVEAILAKLDDEQDEDYDWKKLDR